MQFFLAWANSTVGLLPGSDAPGGVATLIC